MTGGSARGTVDLYTIIRRAAAAGAGQMRVQEMLQQLHAIVAVSRSSRLTEHQVNSK